MTTKTLGSFELPLYCSQQHHETGQCMVAHTIGQIGPETRLICTSYTFATSDCLFNLIFASCWMVAQVE